MAAEQAKAELGQAKAGRLPRMDYLQILGVVPEAKGTGTFSPSKRTDLLSGLGPFTLFTGQSRYVWVRFSPANLFNYTGTIEIGPGYQPVPVDGVSAIYS